MAKKLAFQQRLGDGGTVDRNERILLPGAGVVDSTGDDVLAGAALAQDQDRQVGAGDALQSATQGDDGGAVADNAGAEARLAIQFIVAAHQSFAFADIGERGDRLLGERLERGHVRGA